MHCDETVNRHEECNRTVSLLDANLRASTGTLTRAATASSPRATRAARDALLRHADGAFRA